MIRFIAAAAVAAGVAASAAAQDGSSQQDADRARLEADIARELGSPPPQGARGAAQQAGDAGAPPQPAPPGTPAPPPAANVGGSPFARLLVMPDISAIGSSSLVYDSYDVERRSPREGRFGHANSLTPLFDELELGLQAVVDPYARADVFISFGADSVSVEEAYLTALTLPYGLQARAGRFFAPFGRLNQQHPHTWEFADRPLPMQRLLGGEALAGAGMEASWLAPTPWFAEARASYQGITPGFALGTDATPAVGAAPQQEQRRAGVLRLLQYFDLGTSAVLGVGVSGATMAEPVAGWRDLAGADVYLKLGSGSSKAYVATQGELMWSGLRGTADNRDAWGGYLQAVHRVSSHYGYGARYERAPGLAGGTEHRVGLVGQWLPSEFQRVLLQTSWVRLPDGGDGLEAILALDFAIGAHGAHPF